MSSILNIVLAGLFNAATLFMVTAGLQLIFGVQRILNLAGGSIFAIGAYMGVMITTWALSEGLPTYLFPIVLIGVGVVTGFIGIPMERLIRPVYRKPEAFQLLITFSLVLMLQDAMWYLWGAEPQQLPNLSMTFGKTTLFGATFPTYNLIIIIIAALIAFWLSYFIERTRAGRILRATAENPEISSAMSIDVKRVYQWVFTLGTMIGTIGGALVIPTTAATLPMGVELVVEAFAVIVIGGLGSIKGAVVGAVIIGLTKACAVIVYPEADVLVIYAIVIAVLVFKPSGLFGRLGL